MAVKSIIEEVSAMAENKFKSGLFIVLGGFSLVTIVVSISLMFYIEGNESNLINGVIVLVGAIIAGIVIRSKASDTIKATFLTLPVVLAFDAVARFVMSKTSQVLIYSVMPAVVIYVIGFVVLRYLKATWHYYFAVTVSLGLFLVTILFSR